MRWTRQQAGFYTLGAWSIRRVPDPPGAVVPPAQRRPWRVYRGALCLAGGMGSERAYGFHTLAEAKVWAEAERERLESWKGGQDGR